MNPLMSRKCINLLESYLNKDTVFLEVGSGGSTCHFAPKVKKYCSLEDDEKWHKLVQDEISKQSIENIDYRYIPPNNLENFQRGGKYWKYDDYKDYIEEIGNFGEKFDFIFIDGSSRNHCYLKSFRHVKDDGYVMIHDFYNVEKKEHHDLLWNFDILYKYFDEVESIKQIGPERGNDCIILKKKIGVKYNYRDMKIFDTQIPRY
jgi:hypothetical protein